MNIQQNVSLQAFNTFGIDVLARFFTEVCSTQDLAAVLQHLRQYPQSLLILGGGSNMLFTQDFDGLVLKNSLKGIDLVKEERDKVFIKVAAGENWHQFVLWCIEKNFAGVENLSLIPGCVGAAPMQNIGAYGVELKDVFYELEAMEIATGVSRTFSNEECRFGYRESVFKKEFKNQFIITSVTFRLHNLNVSDHYVYHIDYGDIKAGLAENSVFDLNIRAVSDAVIKIRSSKLPDPKELGNSGSFFKNPVISNEQFALLQQSNPLIPSYPAGADKTKVPAGWLIEQCGWKGKRVGNTGSHAKQALVLVNYGNASGSEVKALATAIQQSVMDKFGIEIEAEVNIY